jgi:hypothetical protein
VLFTAIDAHVRDFELFVPRDCVAGLVLTPPCPGASAKDSVGEDLAVAFCPVHQAVTREFPLQLLHCKSPGHAHDKSLRRALTSCAKVPLTPL